MMFRAFTLTITVFTLRRTSRLHLTMVVGVSACTMLTLAACGPRIVPAAAPTPAPVDAPVATPVLPTVVRYAVPGLVTDTRYRLESVAQLERDSAGRRDEQSVNSQARVVVRQRRTADGAFTASGQLNGYLVKSALIPAPITIDSLRFQAVLDAQALRVVMQPPLANECDRAETGALAMVRDLLIRVPASVAVGEPWRDSTVQLVCRSSVPLVVRTTNEYVIERTERDGNDTRLIVKRTSASRVEGKTTSPWRAVDITGTGTGALTAHISLLSGAVQRAEGTSALTLSVSDKSSTSALRAQQVTQRVKWSAESVGN